MRIPAPYDHIPYPTRHAIHVRVSPEDFAYLRRIFPYLRPLGDYILQTLFHRFIQHLRSLEKTNGQPLDTAWYPNDPTHTLLELILERTNFADVVELNRQLASLGADLILLQRHAVGGTPGPAPGGDEPGAASSVCPTVLSVEIECPNPKGSIEAGSD